MQNVSQPKVFEFAKEIGMETLALMDKIREWKLPVRSHMAELDSEMLEQIKARLKDDGGKKSSGETAKKKKAAAPAAAASGTTAAKATKPAAKKAAEHEAPAKPANSRKTALKKASAPAAEEPVAATAAAAVAGKTVVKKAAAKVVVRRKTEETENEESGAEVQSHDDSTEHDLRSTAAEVETSAQEEAAAPHAAPVRQEQAQPLAAARAADVSEALASPVALPPTAAVSAPVAATASAVAATPQSAPAQAAPSVSTSPITPAGSAPSPITAVSQNQTSEHPPGPGIIVPSRKREVVMTSHGPSSGIKSEAPRRNIVGRMDLSRVQGPQGSSGALGPRSLSPSPIGGSRGIGPRPLRTGFVSSAPIELPDESAEGRRKFEDKRIRAKAGPTPGTGLNATGKTDREEEVKAFLVTEFRKREMVFQPKKKRGSLNRESKQTQITTPKASKRVVKVDQTMKLSELANEIGVKAGQLTKALIQNGVTATMNTALDFDTIALIVTEFGFEAVNVHRTVDELLDASAFGELTAVEQTRPPVVTIMGHVDHGKTSLLDSIRNAKVAAGEAGGITQHIGAYQVTTDLGHLITFIDTPGHEAFTAMRARGANATDIAVIVVAADDGVMPQTIEAVNHAKAAGVPIIVALNKMDKPGANPDKVKQQLTEQQLVPEEWGGETIYVPVSAHTKEGIPQLLEQINLVAEVAELKANTKRSATGLVIESRMDKGRGPVATLLVQDGTLRVGQSIVVGSVPGKVRSLIDFNGVRVTEAGPSMPVEVQGLSDVPQAGDRFDVTEDEKTAEHIAATRSLRSADTGAKGKVSLEDIFAKMKQGDLKELGIVLKSDMAGSSEAIKGMLDKVGNDEVKVKVIHSAVGGINESDVLLASTAKGIVVGFNVRPDGGATTTAKRLSVEIKTYTIVYEMIDDLKKALAGLLTPDIVEKQLGRAEVRNTFTVPKIGLIAGSFVADGKITRSSEVRLVRDGKIVYTGKIGSLKRFKDDAKEVASGYECGIGIENFNDVKVGDIIEAFTKETIVREL